MKDPRFEKLADVIVRHSCELQPGEKILIEAVDIPEELTVAIIRRAVEAGGIPLVTSKQVRVLRELYRNASEESMRLAGEVEAYRMRQVQAYVAVRGGLNSAELSDVPDEKMKLYRRYWWKPVHQELRVPKTKWVVLRYPHPSMAQQANMSTEAFEEFYFRVCTLDYDKMARAMQPLKERMEATDEVHILGPGTDLRFSIRGIPAIPCSGERNLPDGEVFTAPVRDSVEGTVQFNTPTIYQGITFENVRLVFKAGKIVEATAGDKTEQLNKILDSDEGARYTGEFSFGLNPYILQPMKDILFDEKIAGSFHLTPGQAYDEADNGNRSEIHWDMVCIQRPEYGGGEIYLDGELVRKDGRFVAEDLQALNPENLT